MRKMRKYGIMLLCMAMLASPISVQADLTTADLEQIKTDVQEILGEVQLTELLDHRDVLVELVLYARDYVNENKIEKDEIEDLVEEFAEAAGYELGDVEEGVISGLIEKYSDADITEEKIRKDLETAASLMSLAGFDLEDAENLADFAIGFLKGIKG